MRFLTVPKGVGLWGAIYLLFGIFLFNSAFAFWCLNILFSAFGLMGFTGANIVLDTSDIWFSFMPSIVTGGRVGLFLSILGGLICSVVESLMWVSPRNDHKDSKKTTIDKKSLFVWFSIIFLLFDILSTHFFLMGGRFIDFTQGQFLVDKIINGILSFVSVLGITILLFSVGSEMYLIFGLELIVTNWNEGIKYIQQTIFMMFNVGEDDEKEYHKNNFQRNDNHNRPYEDLEKNRIQERFRELNQNDEFRNNGNIKQNNNHKRGRGRPPKEHPKEFQKNNDLLTTIFGNEIKENNFE